MLEDSFWNWGSEMVYCLSKVVCTSVTHRASLWTRAVSCVWKRQQFLVVFHLVSDWDQVVFRWRISKAIYNKVNVGYLFSVRMSGVENIPDEKEAGEDPEPDGLKILSAANFETFLSQTEHVIVMFYAPCKRHVTWPNTILGMNFR